MKSRRLPIFLALTWLLSCSSGEPTIARDAEPDVVGVAGDDDAMNAAMERARATFPLFVEELAKGEGAYSVKMRFEEDGLIEHIWLSSPTVEDDLVWATVDNEPVYVESRSVGDRVPVEPAMVSDWMILREGAVFGAYTIRVLRDRMTPEERAGLDAQLGAVPADLPPSDPDV